VATNGPIIVQVRGYGPNSDRSEIATSGLICCGVVPTKGVLRVNCPWFTTDTAGSHPIFALDVECIDKSAPSRDVYVVFECHFLVGPEDVPAACPTKALKTTAEAEDPRRIEEAIAAASQPLA